MNTSETIKELATALSRFQGQTTPPPKNRRVEVTHKSGGRHSFQYAELATILEHIKKPFAENGLSWTSSVSYEDPNAPTLVTRLYHVSGEWFQTEYLLPMVNDPKIFAGEITYGRRYSITSLLGIASDDDADDLPEKKSSLPRTASAPSSPAVKSSSPVKPNVAAKSPSSASVPGASPITPTASASTDEWKATKDDLQRLMDTAKGNDWPSDSVKDYMVRRFGKERLSEYTKVEYDILVSTVRSQPYTTAMHEVVTTEADPEWMNEADQIPRPGG